MAQSRKVVRQLVVPLLLLALIYNCLFAVSQLLFGAMTLGRFGRNLTGILTGDVFALAGLWFVYTLVLVKVVSMIRLMWVKLAVAIVCLAASCYLNVRFESTNFNSCYVNTLLAFPCFFIGEWLSGHRDRINALSHSGVLVAILAAGVAGVAIAGYNNATVWMYQGGYGSNIFWFLLGSVCGTVACFALCKLFFDRPNKYVLIISQGTIIILAFHGLVIRLTNNFDIGYGFYLEAVAMVVCFIPCIVLCKRYLPVLTGYR